MENNEIPMGLGMALAQNLGAMEKFAALPDSKKAEILILIPNQPIDKSDSHNPATRRQAPLQGTKHCGGRFP